MVAATAVCLFGVFTVETLSSGKAGTGCVRRGEKGGSDVSGGAAVVERQAMTMKKQMAIKSIAAVDSVVIESFTFS